MLIDNEQEDYEQEFCGHCCVCGLPVHLSDMGICGICNNVFHWVRCGNWNDDSDFSSHECFNCNPQPE